MIHHDYLLRLIEEFAAAVSRIRDLRVEQKRDEAARTLDERFREYLDADRATVLRLSATEMLARLMRSGTSLDLRARTLFLVALLRESADLAREQGLPPLANAHRIQALRLLLASPEAPYATETPDFVPTLEALLAPLERDALPADLRAEVMLHHERTGQLAEAENDLFDLLDLSPAGVDLFAFGSAFYRRILALGDATLIRGRLPRAEAMEGYTEFRRRASA